MTPPVFAINYDGRRFTRSDKDVAPIATYRQDGQVLSGSFCGSDVVYGTLCGVVDPDGSVHFGYSMVDTEGRVISGECRSQPSLDDAGRVHLHETWTRFCPEFAQGTSALKEIGDE